MAWPRGRGRRRHWKAVDKVEVAPRWDDRRKSIEMFQDSVGLTASRTSEAALATLIGGLET